MALEYITCHRKCYSSFIHPNSIEALRKKYTKEFVVHQQNLDEPKAGHSKMSSSFTKTRRSVDPIISDLCIFCQTSKYRTQLFNVTTFAVSNSILNNSKPDNTMRIRLSGINDLIAAEAKYHKSCLNCFENSSRKEHMFERTN